MGLYSFITAMRCRGGVYGFITAAMGALYDFISHWYGRMGALYGFTLLFASYPGARLGARGKGERSSLLGKD